MCSPAQGCKVEAKIWRSGTLETTQSLTENEDQDDSDEDIFLGSGSHTSVSGDTNGEAGSERREAATQARSEVLVAGVSGVGPLGWRRRVGVGVFNDGSLWSYGD